jgi:phage-related minor tail protein
MADNETDEPKQLFDGMAEAEAVFRDMAEELTQAMYATRRSRKGGLAAARESVKSLLAAVSLVNEERAKVEKLRKQTGDFAAGREFDLDAARAEIGLRLARLRNAAGH